MNLQITQKPRQSWADEFSAMVKDTLSASEYEALPTNLGITPLLWGRILNAPDTMPGQVAIDLANILGITPKALIEQYGCCLSRHTATELLMAISLTPVTEA